LAFSRTARPAGGDALLSAPPLCALAAPMPQKAAAMKTIIAHDFRSMAHPLSHSRGLSFAF
jgi:hypothetical protein